MDGQAFSRGPLIIGDETVGEHDATASSVVTCRGIVGPGTGTGTGNGSDRGVSPGIAMMDTPGDLRRIPSLVLNFQAYCSDISAAVVYVW